MTGFHTLAPEWFDELAAGDGGSHTVDALRAARRSRHLLLIGHLLRGWPGDPAESRALTERLERARAADPERFAAVVDHPLVGAWTGVAIRAEQRGAAVRSDFTQLAALTVVACAACGVPADAEVPVRDGVVPVPGLGVLRRPGATRARLSTDGDGIEVRVGAERVRIGRDEAGWWPVRHLDATAAGRTLRLALDDVDPYRHGHHVPPTGRLADADVRRWRDLTAGAWSLLATHLPGRAAELAAGLRTVVPLAQIDAHTAGSATLRHAFGSFGATCPPSAAEFAATMVHEFQHSKLCALLDITPLSGDGDDRRYFAPWRSDPRPLPGMLQGVYAFAGVADVWRALREVDDLAAPATARFAETRLQLDAALTGIERSGDLTDAGRRLVAGLRRTTDGFLAERIDDGAARAAAATLDRTRRAWWDRHRSAAGVRGD